MRYIFLLLFVVASVASVSSQDWRPVTQSDIRSRGKKDIVPDNYLLYRLDDHAMHKLLWEAPREERTSPVESEVVITVPNRAGDMVQYSIVEYSMMESELAAKYKEIKTFIGVQVDDPNQTIRIDYTVQGFRAVMDNVGDRTYIDHYQRGDVAHRIVYKKEDLTNTSEWSCGVEGHDKLKDLKPRLERSSRAGDCNFRTYRMAQTAVGEYSNYFDAFNASQSALVHSAVVTAYNRVNQVYEAELAARFLLINNTDDIYYYNPATDPFVSQSLNENQSNTDAVIGNDNYDIGHIFIISGGGVAQLRSLCNTGSKARGLTGQNDPVGDPFYIDYVAHEIGHQFGGNHTQNNSCNRNTATAMEPGSASTIMGYAGICSPNVQSNSDAYFHSISIQEMNIEMLDETCDAQLPWNNAAPTLNSLVTDRTLPVSTPFVLQGDADSNNANDLLTYNWEQIDNEPATMPPASTNTGGPAFRSLFATEDPRRYFPSIDNVVNGTTDTWEVLPSVSRVMDFRLTVRDLHAGMGGCTAEQDVRLTFDANSGPFVVNTANTQQTYNELQVVAISWDVADTDQSPVDCANVDILMSYDGGLTYTATLLANTANDGSADVTIPLGTTSTGRFMVKCSNNYFFDINDANFTVEVGAPNFALSSNPGSATLCEADDAVSFDVVSTSIMSYSNPITLAVTGQPAGSTTVIANNPITPGQSTTITISGLSGLTGLFDLNVQGSTSDFARQTSFSLSKQGLPGVPSPVSPADNAVDIATDLLLTWTPVAGADGYEFEIGSTEGASDIATGTTTVAEAAVTGLSIETEFFWRVRSTDICGNSPWSASRSFTTRPCKSFSSTDLPLTIISNVGNTITSSFAVRDKGTVTDFNVLNLIGTHTWTDDLRFTVIGPDNTSSLIWDQPCDDDVNYNINFDDEANNSNWPCPAVNGGTYVPDNPLSGFIGKSISGTWQMQVEDVFNGADGGDLQSYSYEFCMSNYCDLTVNLSTYAGVGGIQNAVDCANAGDTIWLETTIPAQTVEITTNTIFIQKNLTIIADGPTTITAANGNAVFEIVKSVDVSFVGFDIENSAGLAIKNDGNLTVENVNVSTATSAQQVLIGATGSLTVKGDCNISEQ